MGVGFGACENILGNDGNDTVGAGAGVEPVSMVIIPKNAKSGEGVKVVNLTKGTETNKALSDLGLIVSDLVKNYFSKSSDDYDDLNILNLSLQLPKTNNKLKKGIF